MHDTKVPVVTNTETPNKITYYLKSIWHSHCLTLKLGVKLLLQYFWHMYLCLRLVCGEVFKGNPHFRYINQIVSVQLYSELHKPTSELYQCKSCTSLFWCLCVQTVLSNCPSAVGGQMQLLQLSIKMSGAKVGSVPVCTHLEPVVVVVPVAAEHGC